MRIKIVILLMLLFVSVNYAQIVYTTPANPTEKDAIELYFRADLGTAGLKNYTGDVYAHTGVITNKSTSDKDWKYVIAEWTSNIPKAKLERVETNLYKLSITPSIRSFYNVPVTEKILKIALVFRSGDRSKEGKDTGGTDIFLDVFQEGLSVVLNSPAVSLTFTDPLRTPVFAAPTGTITLNASAVRSTQIKSFRLFINDNKEFESADTSLNYDFVAANFQEGVNNIKLVAIDNTSKDSVQFVIMRNPEFNTSALPAGMRPGINYYAGDPTKVTLALFAPYKNYAYLIGDFDNTDWKVDKKYFMNKEVIKPDSTIFWITIENLSPGTEYAVQYFVDGEIRTADPYSEKVLDPWNDKYIPSSVYPYPKAYPAGKTEWQVTTIKPSEIPYQWNVTNFLKPAKENLIVYELLVRDFVSTHSYQTLSDTLSYLKRLGVNAIELMPVMEFDGNESWGYNPAFHVALDKYYGTKNMLKAFIDKCHENGIAVILDMVLNHVTGASPLARLYWNGSLSRPLDFSPYLNAIPKHEFNVFNDVNHESNATKYWVDRVNEYWLKEYKFDGYRFDLSKGFTQKNTLGNANAMAAYDQSRINILKRMANKIWETDSTAYVILEHFADNSEERVLADYGMMLWGNHNYNYNEATMGYLPNSNFSGISYKNRNFSKPNLVGYMESHDEERLMYKNIQFGNAGTNYNIKETNIALERIKLAAAFFFTVPGPKMVWQFGELGYDISKFADPNGVVPTPYGDERYKVGPKPIRWNYQDDVNRAKVYKVFSYLINLKKNYPVFSTADFTLELTGFMKKIKLNDASMNVNIIGNFDVKSGTINPTFKSTGWWYDYFAGDSINVTDTQALINLGPGEFKIYTDKKLPAPEAGLVTDIESEQEEIPTGFLLEQNYPNPFNPSTTIKYSLAEPGFVSLKIYNTLGQEIITLINNEKNSGYYSVNWNGKDAGGMNVASGIYLYSLKAGGAQSTKKMLLLK
ncbi:MAG: alpha-amylase family glycosyl hydrolase [Melioribacteraceae bacterium]|nr:alpha-amylase family glycosyl hydrolase [Melioribacteraceae bacterium]